MKDMIMVRAGKLDIHRNPVRKQVSASLSGLEQTRGWQLQGKVEGMPEKKHPVSSGPACRLPQAVEH